MEYWVTRNRKKEMGTEDILQSSISVKTTEWEPLTNNGIMDVRHCDKRWVRRMCKVKEKIRGNI